MQKTRFITGQELYAFSVIIPLALLAFTWGFDIATAGLFSVYSLISF